MEEQWFKKSTGKMQFITISEKQLDQVLAGENIETRKRDNTNFDFRF